MLCWKKNIPTVAPAARASSQTRGPRTSSEDCSQNDGRRVAWHHQPLLVMPCAAGSSPVRSVACATQVTAG